MSRLESAQAAILGHDEILERLNRGQVFVGRSTVMADGLKPTADTWVPASVRAARYDLRLAPDRLIIPASPGHKSRGEEDFERHWSGEEIRHRRIVLRRGEVAFVSTRERFCMPWDLAGNIGLKFALSQQGLLALAGLHVDPGFGYVRTEAGDFAAAEDERLHLLLANLGEHDVALDVDHPIASIQFLKVSRPMPGKPIRTSEAIRRRFFADSSSAPVGLGFVAELAGVVDARNEEMVKVDRRLNRLEGATENVVVFGVFVLAVALVAGFLTLLINAAGEIGARRLDELLPAGDPWRAGVWVVAFMVLAYLGGWFVAVVRAAFRGARQDDPERVAQKKTTAAHRKELAAQRAQIEELERRLTEYERRTSSEPH